MALEDRSVRSAALKGTSSPQTRTSRSAWPGAIVRPSGDAVTEITADSPSRSDGPSADRSIRSVYPNDEIHLLAGRASVGRSSTMRRRFPFASSTSSSYSSGPREPNWNAPPSSVAHRRIWRYSRVADSVPGPSRGDASTTTPGIAWLVSESTTLPVIESPYPPGEANSRRTVRDSG